MTPDLTGVPNMHVDAYLSMADAVQMVTDLTAALAVGSGGAVRLRMNILPDSENVVLFMVGEKMTGPQGLVLSEVAVRDRRPVSSAH